MWICVQCKAGLLRRDFQPESDDLGMYIVCPWCGRRNNLQSLDEGGDGRLVVVQEDVKGECAEGHLRLTD